MINSKLTRVLVLGIVGTLFVITCVKFLPIKKVWKKNHTAQAHDDAQYGPVTQLKTEKEIEHVVKGKRPFVIKFFADWCGACTYVKMPFNEIAHSIHTVDFYEVDVDNQAVMDYIDKHKIAKDGIDALPTFILRDGSKVNEQIEGGMKKEELEQKIKKAFS